MTNTNTTAGEYRNPEWPSGLDWSDVTDMFPYEEPRDVQKDGMESVLDAASDDGYVLMEGACGTGKTLIALAPYLAAVRNPNTEYERIAVVTSVKQQQRAFEDEVRRINKKLEQNDTRPVSAMTLVGKADVCPYVQQDTIGNSEIYSECDRLRENTSDIVSGDKGMKKRAENLVKRANSDHENPDEASDFAFDADIPHDDRSDTDYCGYYAQHLAWKAEDASNDDDAPPSATLPFDLDTVGLITPERLMRLSGEAGTCPHSVMGEALGHVEVVIANYYHLFEPTTVETFTNDLLDDSTLVVVDEAHNLVPNVRDLLNRERTTSSFQKAIRETRELLPLMEYDRKDIERIGNVLAENGALAGTVLEDELKDVYADIEEKAGDPATLAASPEQFIALAQELYEKIEDLSASPAQLEAYADFLESFTGAVNTTIQDEFTDYQSSGDEAPYEFEVPLREPRLEPDAAGAEWKDKLSSWMELIDDDEGVVPESDEIGKTVVALQSHLRSEVLDYDDLPQFSAQSAGEFISMWREFDETRYFRCIQMERRPTQPGETYEFDWQEDYKATLTLYNCIPREEIADRLSEFGSGVLMSATLVPLHVYREVTGLDELQAKGRTVIEEQYGLSFPEENRMSFSVDAPSFTYNNKGRAFDNPEDANNPNKPLAKVNPNVDNEVREEYAQAIFSVVQTTPGNVLVTMPSYSEAKWAGALLHDHPDIDGSRILVDESSTNLETEQMKQEFFESDDAVLLTGAHGTLTEGIDYKGDRLDGVVCCGVPIENTNNVFSKAVRTAYEVEFGKSNGFEYAFTVPAVRKTRQALGRVIRADTDVGVRVLVDERYTDSDSWDNVREFLSPNEQHEFQDVETDTLFNQLRAFWKYHENRG